jgi:hypothetical protein
VSASPTPGVMERLETMGADRAIVYVNAPFEPAVERVHAAVGAR